MLLLQQRVRRDDASGWCLVAGDLIRDVIDLGLVINNMSLPPSLLPGGRGETSSY